MASKGLDEASVYSGGTTSECEDSVQKLFMACDTDTDGFVDSHEFQNICHKLSVDECKEELMQEIRADDKISFNKFLDCKLLLPKAEIPALKKRHSTAQNNDDSMKLQSSSSNSLGKHENWEFDSGARDLSPEPNALQNLINESELNTTTGNILELANKLHLEAITTLKTEICELINKLHTVSEEREAMRDTLKKYQMNAESSKISEYEEQIAELHSIITELNKEIKNNSSAILKEDEQLSDNVSLNTFIIKDDRECKNVETAIIENVSQNNKNRNDEIDELKIKIDELNEEVAVKDAELKNTKILLTKAYKDITKMKSKYLRESERKSQNNSCKSSPKITKKINEAATVSSKIGLNVTPSTSKIAAAHDSCQKNEQTNSETNKEISHNFLNDLSVLDSQNNCSLEERGDKDNDFLEIEVGRLNAKLEHLKAQNYTLQINFHNTRDYCERMYILLGKYESQAIAFKASHESCQQMINYYDALVYFLEKHVPNSISTGKEIYHIKSILSRIKADYEKVINTTVTLESYFSYNPEENLSKYNMQEMKKIDLEMAVVLQELMESKEKNSELKATIYTLEQERETLSIKVSALQSQLNAYTCLDTDTKFSEGDVNSKLQENLREVAATMEKVIRNSDLRNKQSIEQINILKNSNSGLLKTIEKYKKKSQMKMRNLESEMINMMDKHAKQVATLKRRNEFFEALNKEKYSTDIKSPPNIDDETKKNENPNQ